MKKLLLWIGLCLLILGFWCLVKLSSAIYKNDIIYSLVMDVAQFTNEDHNRLPHSWLEFVEWNKSRGRTRWKTAFLNTHFQLIWGIKAQESSRYNRIFIIKDQDIKNSEKGFDDLLRREINAP